MSIEKNKEKLGKQIKERRKLLNISQGDLSLHSGVHQSNLSALENGNSNATLETLCTVAEVLGMEIAMVEKGDD